jgi:hypothetical protein
LPHIEPSRAEGATHPAAARPAVNARPTAALLLAACAAVLGLAAWLSPDPRGLGTHQKLGTGPCGMLVMTGLPCPTCGMTTAFAHTVRGQWVRAAWSQPAGFLYALATIGCAIVCIITLVTGRVPRAIAARSPIVILFSVLAVLLGGWGFKLIAGLLDGSLPYAGVAL